MTKRLARDVDEAGKSNSKKQAEQRNATQTPQVKGKSSTGWDPGQCIHTRRKEPRSGRVRYAHPWNSGVAFPTFFREAKDLGGGWGR